MSFRRNKSCIHNCPECGIFVCFEYQNMLSGTRNMSEDGDAHECDPTFLRKSKAARDAAMSRDSDYDAPRERPIAERLARGFEMLAEDDYGDIDD